MNPKTPPLTCRCGHAPADHVYSEITRSYVCSHPAVKRYARGYEEPDPMRFCPCDDYQLPARGRFVLTKTGESQ